MRRATILATVCALALSQATASASPPAHRHRGHARRTLAAEPASGATSPVLGGVPGNLPFDNQLRKFSDPLGANGAK